MQVAVMNPRGFSWMRRNGNVVLHLTIAGQLRARVKEHHIRKDTNSDGRGRQITVSVKLLVLYKDTQEIPKGEDAALGPGLAQLSCVTYSISKLATYACWP